MQPPNAGPLLGVGPAGTVAAAEKLAYVEAECVPLCYAKCIHHSGEDSIPYHPGEKTCVDRCIAKIVNGADMMRPITQALQTRVKSGVKESGMQWLDAVEEQQLARQRMAAANAAMSKRK